MKCAPFEYVRAGSVAEAVTVLRDTDGEGKILAGGQSLVPILALRMARPAVLVDVNRIPDLDGVARNDGSVRIGALTRHSALVAQTEHPLLAEAARWIGHAAIRTRGTAGGSIAHADPAAELPAVAVGCGATVHVAGPAGERSVPATELFVGALMTGLGEDEMITGLDLPVPARWGFAEFARRHGDFALVTAVVAEIEGEIRVTVGGAAPVPVRASRAEAVLAAGGPAAEAGRAAAEDLRPTGDLHGSADYRRAIAGEMVRRALAQAGVGTGAN
ncbi:FAD binding domain-containing protein [Pseudonocardia bannensis]|uniref:Xanthine dehydrogenase family protein subunit M n=1 Tax=Pseudonocardia bannensis TaxID=630973 RepID=A0A848DMF1_9PSEU|nr:FAD binding domain-containing protein [Pseudonocardia bannensis]NMH93676.1 xanthine dehydrogenase family protein subunit M [Pseudonocardia bannensis]